ncbi:MAG: tryptophan--tRNA ligase, partial [bacterium]|nr:tryptophan--tRNA ligase [bacterium]
AFKQAIELQGKAYQRFYFIADYHSLTQKYDPKRKADDIFNVAVDALALGIDPKKSTFFVQSHVTEHANLAWILNTITSIGDLERMVEYKEKIAQGQIPNAGLFNYPVLMAADILIYNADVVPVGDDQRQHLELTRTLARTFNKRFGKTFTEPTALHNKTPRVMSLNNPAQKMSKSIPSGCLFLSDPPLVIKKKIMSAQTDSQKKIGYDPKKRPAVSNLIDIYAGFAGISTEAVVRKYKNTGYAKFKSDLAGLLTDFLEPFRENRAALMKNKKVVLKILEDGDKRAGKVAIKKLEEIKGRVGLI